ncbi:hypothetical protein AS1_39 [Marinobacter phage AS1]|nr:hypothetical protein AS1_39 [Marinobacter phage AS1]
MIEESSSSLQVADAIMRWLVALAGWAVALWGWRVRGRQTREIADNTETNKAIDVALVKIEELEEIAVEYWKDTDSKIVPAQLSSAVANCIFFTQQISSLSSQREIPYKDFAEVRKSVTLNMEHEERGFEKQRSRISRIVRLIGRLKRAEIYQKKSFIKK